MILTPYDTLIPHLLCLLSSIVCVVSLEKSMIEQNHPGCKNVRLKIMAFEGIGCST